MQYILLSKCGLEKFSHPFKGLTSSCSHYLHQVVDLHIEPILSWRIHRVPQMLYKYFAFGWTSGG